MPHPVITLLTDFGLSDHYAAAMKGVMLGIAPHAALADISHLIQPYRIAEAAYELAQAWKCFPPGTVHLVVVDPGVGSSRRAIAVAAGGHYFVGPDNGVFSLALRGIEDVEVREITAAHLFRQPVSNTFHGRDIFAPVAARLACGMDFSETGPVLDGFRTLEGMRPKMTGEGEWAGEILKVDRFGNAITNFEWGGFSWVAEKAFELAIGSTILNGFKQRYSAAAHGELFVLRGSGDYLEVSSNQSDAAAERGLRGGQRAILRSL